ncbi:hypothetical protein BOTBODRAFT_39859 [Botryobasidium botryosum FD-172 SS1]|uniref:Uncharacterized protein n=1 Tax=Botryobasidium botryosum (strain FD-172 SS1) TaxID=930990 RepID=A0A067M352_BOTB1|nr:hypothetical protein BOTBODRAFT_39859 [Botryobasidium botryosum FD-172 SS1]
MSSDSRNSTSVQPAQYSGNFDLYSTQLPFLTKEYHVKGSTTPQYEALYNKILFYQARDDRSARASLPSPGSSSPGTFWCSQVADPMSDEPFDVTITSIQDQSPVSFTSAEKTHFAAPRVIPLGAGIAAQTNIIDGGCFVLSGKGSFKLVRVWANTTSTGAVQELFEGIFSLRVRFAPIYARKGWNTDVNFVIGFWAVRGLAKAEEAMISDEDAE